LVGLILLAIWAAVLLPPWLQNRRERRPSDSIGSFRSQLATLQRTAPGTPLGSGMTYMPVGLSRSEARRRRRDILFTLAAAAGVTLMLSLLLGTPVLVLHLLIDVLLVSYIALLVHTQQQATERARKVRYLPTQSQVQQPALLLRRSGS
jgi:hypothetical protein